MTILRHKPRRPSLNRIRKKSRGFPIHKIRAKDHNLALDSDCERRVHLSKSHFNESRKSLNNLDTVSENTLSFIRYHTAQDNDESHPLYREGRTPDIRHVRVGPNIGHVEVKSHWGMLILGPEYPGLLSKSRFNQSHIEETSQESLDKPPESTWSPVRHYLAKHRLFGLWDPTSKTKHDPPSISPSESRFLSSKPSIQYFFKGQRVGGMGDVHGGDISQDDSEIYAFRRITYRDIEVASTNHRGKTHDIAAFTAHMFKSGPEEMEDARAREAAQTGSSIAFKPEQPTWGLSAAWLSSPSSRHGDSQPHGSDPSSEHSEYE